MKSLMRRNLACVIGMIVFLSAATTATAAPPSSWTLCEGTVLNNFAVHPALESVKAGDWNDPTTWDKNRAPEADDDLVVHHKVKVTRSAIARNILITDLGAELALDPGSPLEFRFKTILATERGRLSATPAKGVVQKLIVRDLPLDPTDTEQMGNGIVIFGYGQVVLQGQAKTAHEQLLAGAARSDSALLLRNPVSGWEKGDQVYIADTRVPTVKQRSPFVSWDEVLTLTEGTPQAAKVQPLLFDHPAAYDSKGGLRASPSLANLTRNLVISSENPDGVRGHMMCTEHVLAVVEYVEFANMGRTLMGDINSSNPKGRYPLHAHHLMGSCGCRTCDRAAGPYLEDGQQFRFVGNVIHDTQKWGLVVHASSYGVITDNVIVNGRGAGLVFEDGSEVGNTIRHNFVSRIIGLGTTYFIGNKGDNGSIYTWGTGGFGIVIRNMLNDVTLNRVEGLGGSGISSGFNLFLRETKSPKLCSQPGEMPDTCVDVRRVGNQFKGRTYVFDGNLVFGDTPVGITIWDTGGAGKRQLCSGDVGLTKITNLTLAHTFSKGVSLYEAKNLYLQGAVIGTPTATNLQTGTGFLPQAAYHENLTVEMVFDSMNTAVLVPSWASSARFVNCQFSNNAVDLDIRSPGGNQTPKPIPEMVRFDQCVFGKNYKRGVHLQYRIWSGIDDKSIPLDVSTASRIIFTALNNDPTADYEWFRTQQAPDALIPISTSKHHISITAPIAAAAPDGKPTNRWADANRAFGAKPLFDRVATGDTTLPGFTGFMVQSVDPALASYD